MTTSRTPARIRDSRDIAPFPPRYCFWLSPSNMRCWRLGRQHLSSTCLGNFGNLIHAAPLGRDHEQRLLVWTPQHTREATAVKVHRLFHLAAFAHADATLVGNVCIPN